MSVIYTSSYHIKETSILNTILENENYHTASHYHTNLVLPRFNNGRKPNAVNFLIVVTEKVCLLFSQLGTD